MKTTNLLSILFGFFFISCGDGNDKPTPETVIITQQGFYVVNEEGEDLLDPDKKDGINISKLKIYYLVDGKKIEALDYFRQTGKNPPLGGPVGYSISEEKYQGKYCFTVFLNDAMVRNNGTTSLTFIEWDKNNIDTVTAKNIMHGSRYFESRMIKFNDMDWTGGYTEIFTIIR